MSAVADYAPTKGTGAGRSHILVVDDHASARTSMADVLEHAGHRADCCASAHEALSRLEKQE